MTGLSELELDEMRGFADSLKPLYPSIKTACRIDSSVAVFCPVRAPHYISVFSENTEGYLENAGFMFQQLDLFLSSKGCGSCWLGLAKPISRVRGMASPIILSFGRPAENLYRDDITKFRRKDIAEISKGHDSRLEAARLAPSASNTQNWFFACGDDGRVDVYQKLFSNPVKAAMYGNFNRLDAGIAICHLYLATLHEGREFSFIKKDGAEEMKGYLYIGTVI